MNDRELNETFDNFWQTFYELTEDLPQEEVRELIYLIDGMRALERAFVKGKS